MDGEKIMENSIKNEMIWGKPTILGTPHLVLSPVFISHAFFCPATTLATVGIWGLIEFPTKKHV